MILIAYLITSIVVAVSLAKIFFAVLGYLPKIRDARIMELEHRIPSWHLFGHRGPTYDCYVIMGVRKEFSAVEEFYPLTQPTRHWFDGFYNPFSKMRFLIRQRAQAYLFYSLTSRPQHWEAQQARKHLEWVARHYQRECVFHSAVDGELSLYLVIDRGHFSQSPPEAKSVIAVREL